MDRLNMWKIQHLSKMITFTMFEKDNFEIILTRGPTPDATSWPLYPAFEIKGLEDGWILIAVERAHDAELISLWERNNGVTQLKPLV